MLQLAYPLESTVNINGIKYVVDMTFDNVLRLIDLLDDKEIDDETKLDYGLEILIGATLEKLDINDREQIFVDLFEGFIGKGVEDSQPVDLDGNPMPSNDKEDKIYCLKQDADYVYASFLCDYGIDLIEQQGKLDWRKFRALLSGLTDGSKFLRVIEIRTMELPKGKGTEKQRADIKKMKKQYALKGDDLNET